MSAISTDISCKRRSSRSVVFPLKGSVLELLEGRREMKEEKKFDQVDV